MLSRFLSKQYNRLRFRVLVFRVWWFYGLEVEGLRVKGYLGSEVCGLRV